VREIEAQLKGRPDTSRAWADNPERQETAERICQLIRDDFNWPNDHFIPDDPLFIVWWAHTDGLDGSIAKLDVEKAFRVKLFDEDLVRLWHDGTLGDFVDFVLRVQTKNA